MSFLWKFGIRFGNEPTKAGLTAYEWIALASVAAIGYYLYRKK